jgi:zinc D-Ala-D-Ala carboxypeptidase
VARIFEMRSFFQDLSMLSPHFSEEELNVEGADERIRANAGILCHTLLEPIRAQYSLPMHVTSGFRPELANKATGGVSDSEHLYDDDHAAADFTIPGIALGKIFEWIRLLSGLDFRQVILEYEHGYPACIHISCRVRGNDKREALVGETHGNGAYHAVEVGPLRIQGEQNV